MKRLFIILFFHIILSISLVTNSNAGNVFVENFEDARIGDWLVYDELDKNLSWKGPSDWKLKEGGIDGIGLYQGANLWGDPTDTIPIGSIIIYSKLKWTDFVLEVDVLTTDDDTMGIVWRFNDLTEHYRFVTLQSNLDKGESGPWRKLEVRLGKGKGEKLPFYKTIKTEKGKSYTSGTPTNWKLTVRGNTFSVEIDGKRSLLGTDDRYKSSGYIGFTISSQQGVFFDNLSVTDILDVQQVNVITLTWSKIKSLHK